FAIPTAADEPDARRPWLFLCVCGCCQNAGRAGGAEEVTSIHEGPRFHGEPKTDALRRTARLITVTNCITSLPILFQKGRPMRTSCSRRQILSGLSATAITSLAATTASAQEPKPAADPFTYCLNTATIRGQGLSIADEVDLAAKAGYQAI